MKEFLAIWLGSVFAKAKDEEGQGLVEYALIIALVSIALIATLSALSGNIGNIFTTIRNALIAAS